MKQEEVIARARAVGQQRQMVEMEMERLMLSLVDLSNSLKTVKSLGDEEVLVPIGGGALVRAKFTTKKAFIPIGAGYTAEYGLENATAEIDKRTKLTEKAIQTLRGELKKLDEEFRKLEQAYRKISEGGA